MNVRVRVTDVSHVQPAEQKTTNNEPAARDHHAAAIKLSPFDTMFLGLPPIQRLFIYDHDGAGGEDPPLARRLRDSLAATLALFTPLAGKLTACSDSDLVIDCSPEAVRPGVRFVEAEYSGDMRRLARDVEHDTEAFLQLVPELDVRRLPAPVLAVQVTRSASAVAVGVSIHHAVADGKSLWQFMRAWAATSRDGSQELLPTPTFDRADILRHPKARPAARQFARLLAPDMPTMNTLPEPDWTRQSRRTYLLPADQIRSLKRRISQAAAENQPPPTSYVAIASVLWTSIARAAKSPDNQDATDEDDAYFLFPAACARSLSTLPSSATASSSATRVPPLATSAATTRSRALRRRWGGRSGSRWRRRTRWATSTGGRRPSRGSRGRGWRSRGRRTGSWRTRWTSGGASPAGWRSCPCSPGPHGRLPGQLRVSGFSLMEQPMYAVMS